MTNIRITKAQWFREMFGAKYPELFSKRGFEHRRVKLVIPEDRNELAYVTDINGNKLDVEL
jgi:hypothetical protein